MGEPKKAIRSMSSKDLFSKPAEKIGPRPGSSEDKRTASSQAAEGCSTQRRRSLSQGSIQRPTQTPKLDLKPTQDQIDDYFIAYTNSLFTKKIRQDIEMEVTEIDKLDKELKYYRDRNAVLEKLLFIQEWISMLNLNLDVEKINELSVVRKLLKDCAENNQLLSAGVEEQLLKLSHICGEIKDYHRASSLLKEGEAVLQEKLQHYVDLKTRLDQILKEAELVMTQHILLNKNEKSCRTC